MAMLHDANKIPSYEHMMGSPKPSHMGSQSKSPEPVHSGHPFTTMAPAHDAKAHKEI